MRTETDTIPHITAGRTFAFGFVFDSDFSPYSSSSEASEQPLQSHEQTADHGSSSVTVASSYLGCTVSGYGITICTQSVIGAEPGDWRGCQRLEARRGSRFFSFHFPFSVLPAPRESHGQPRPTGAKGQPRSDGTAKGQPRDSQGSQWNDD